MYWNFSDMFVYLCIIIKLFLWIFRVFMEFLWQLKSSFSVPYSSLPGSGDRPDRSTDVHKTCTLASHLGRSTERSTDCKYPTLGWGRSTVRLGRSTEPSTGQRAICSLDWHGRPGSRPRLQRSNFWPLAVDRAGRPPAARAEKQPQRLVFPWGYLYPIERCFWLRFEEPKIQSFPSVLFKFSKVF